MKKTTARNLMFAVMALSGVALSGTACDRTEAEATRSDPVVVAAVTAARQDEMAETYAAAAANLRASLAELRRTRNKEPVETADAVAKKIAELDAMSKTMRALAVQTRAEMTPSR